jgi:predicted phage terminase large subunit-like protein
VDYVHQGRYTHGRFTRYLCQAVQDFVTAKTGNAYDIMLLSVPPQHGKSMTITETLPSWYLGHNPQARVIEASYNSDFAKRFTKRNRDKIAQYGKDIFGIELGGTDAAEEFVLSNGIGRFISRGILSGITGEPAELIIIDDPVKNRMEADSETSRSNVYDEWLSSIKSRLGVGAKVILIMTRWHKDDLYGKLLATERNVTRINFPVECEAPDDPLGREIGETLCPEIGRTKEWWQDFKYSFLNTDGSRALYAMYYGRPSSIEGHLFKRDWLEKSLYTELPQLAFKGISVDATFKDSKTSDFVSIQAWGTVRKDHYLIDRTKRIMGFVDTLKEIDRFVAENPDYNAIYVEDKANGSAIIDVIGRKYRAVIPVNPSGGKEARANAVSPMVEAGNVHLRKDKDGDMIEELVDFPLSDHDDDTDCMTQYLNKVKGMAAQLPQPKPIGRLDYEDEVNNVLNYGG